jgi:hypothetical protein
MDMQIVCDMYVCDTSVAAHVCVCLWGCGAVGMFVRKWVAALTVDLFSIEIFHLRSLLAQVHAQQNG